MLLLLSVVLSVLSYKGDTNLFGVHISFYNFMLILNILVTFFFFIITTAVTVVFSGVTFFSFSSKSVDTWACHTWFSSSNNSNNIAI